MGVLFRRDGQRTDCLILSYEVFRLFPDYCSSRAMLRFPSPALLNQVPLSAKDVVRTRRGSSSQQLNDNLSRVLLFPWYIPRDNLRGESLGYIALQRNKRSHKEHDTTKRVDITLESRSFWVTIDSKDFRCTPSRIKIAAQGCCSPLQIRVLCDRCETKICQARIP